VLEGRALRHELGRHVGMVIDADVVAVEDMRQCGTLERFRVHHDRRIIPPVDAGKDRVKLVVAVDEDRFHACFPPLRLRQL